MGKVFIDPYPGPRNFDEIQKRKKFNESICFINNKLLLRMVFNLVKLK